ncbi:hypothetical protein [Paraburkholderia tropica]|uniref:hypothetical protein n=1 Tax=Paraburkholderia tropica TaxID=92647 RepID=UPI002AB69BA1|nr:hypothetical protein [Paraburkholderia tropica]
MKLEDTWLTVPVSDVLQFWVDQYEPAGEGQTIIKREYFVDTVKNVVVFKLTTETA